jgi:two-component system, OmpR family, phosphate regulon sensor histidine kinase PhoR
MTRRQRIGIVVVISGVLLFATVIFTVIFFLTGFIYQRIGQAPPPLTAYLINTLAGFISCFFILGTLGRILGSRQHDMRMGVFGPILEAMQKIAHGDFSVRLDSTYENHDIVGVLAKNVNNMALELDQMEKMRQEFISNVSHELQSPLTSIRGFAQAMQSDDVSIQDRKHYLSIIETESMRLSKLTDNLLKLASLESEHVKFEPKAYRLDKQIRNLILACEPQWAAKTIDLEVSLQEVEATADEDLLSQVWMNLIHNSIKFTPTGGKICADLQRQGENIAFKISDTGVGISQDDQAHIFERFYKVDKARTRSDNGGSGLGLSIAKKIVEMHNGTIAVTSQPGAGTTFTVMLPAE